MDAKFNYDVAGRDTMLLIGCTIDLDYGCIIVQNVSKLSLVEYVKDK